ncbi:hypothetical protein CLOSTHATH_01929 [Hungatella hathewayi DSM 13479]|uniref:Uncharacterized protein n=1 Tax=Hungatella hathewayi DSM 13479 TaxID=566550 RepID=D3AE99_9FIRM|nr:hypothetical protein CLOSTHATH_01929 [Hungatella hathewayi DSM 13479]
MTKTGLQPPSNFCKFFLQMFYLFFFSQQDYHKACKEQTNSSRPGTKEFLITGSSRQEVCNE